MVVVVVVVEWVWEEEEGEAVFSHPFSPLCLPCLTSLPFSVHLLGPLATVTPQLLHKGGLPHSPVIPIHCAQGMQMAVCECGDCSVVPQPLGMPAFLWPKGIPVTPHPWDSPFRGGHYLPHSSHLSLPCGALQQGVCW